MAERRKEDLKLVEANPKTVVRKDFLDIKPEKIEKTQFIYLHKYLYGGATTFTAHLIHKLGVFNNSRNTNHSCATNVLNANAILRCGKISERKLREFGYGLHYHNISPSILAKIKYPFLTIFKENYFHALLELNRRSRDRLKDIVLVIHDHRDVSYRAAPYVKNWRLVAIRRTVQEYMRNRYGLDCAFLYQITYRFLSEAVVVLLLIMLLGSLKQEEI